ncbi:hypothetical protein C462_00022 [Halorubrum distributum JCM 13916]|uniref:Uncharacterized protein n=1 Tax=Halorubrum distributum JCM 13916 TaxID=1230455 RepID=M0PS42_9EURY|nr:hypothetical protein C462_00022 [Halorubrum arcis JCM 13916]
MIRSPRMTMSTMSLSTMSQIRTQMLVIRSMSNQQRQNLIRRRRRHQASLTILLTNRLGYRGSTVAME